jgi:tetrahydromethanopterin S-methyltransferase subunit B
MVYFKSMDEIKENRTELEKVVKQLVKFMDQLPN